MYTKKSEKERFDLIILLLSFVKDLYWIPFGSLELSQRFDISLAGKFDRQSAGSECAMLEIFLQF